MSEKKNQFTMNPDGAVSLSTNEDGSLNIKSDKKITTDLGTITSVGIENLVDVKSHEITELYNFISHLVKFRDGGEVEFAYNSKGEILKCAGRNVLTTIENGSQLTFKMKGKT